jgi:hypothetical protein
MAEIKNYTMNFSCGRVDYRQHLTFAVQKLVSTEIHLLKDAILLAKGVA